MRTSPRSLTAFAVALSFAAASCSDATRPAESPVAARFLAAPNAFAAQTIPNEYIVVLKPGITDVRRESDYARSLGGQVFAEWSHALHGFWAQLPPAAVSAILDNPRIDFVEPNALATISAQQICPAGYVNCSWGIDRIDQSALPLDLQYNYPANNASTVHAYILDTGMRISHQQFGGRASYGFDYIDNDAIADDCNGHGTHVSGTVGGSTFGVAKGVQLVAVRVLNCSGSGSWGQVISGINWVTANAIKPAVANMSLGGGASSSVDQAVTNSIASGVAYAIAAGNSNTDACSFSPARVPAAITVGATGGGSGIPPSSPDSRASYSNFGGCLDLFAPGTNITSSWLNSDVSTNTISGTSMAAPHVAGVAALYLAQHTSDTPAQVAAALISNATNNVVGNPGSGSPNKLLNLTFLNGGPPNQAPVADFSITCDGVQQLCTLDGGLSTDDSGLGGATFSWSTNSPRPAKTGQIITRFYSTDADTPNTFQETLTVTDAGGLTNSVTKTVVIPSQASNQPPTAAISQPGSGAGFTQGVPVTFQGSGTDPEEGSLGGGSLVWTSNRDGQIGTGTTFTNSNLSVGTHLITLTATDGQNATGTAQISITINATTNQAPVANFTITCDAVQHSCTYDAGLSTDDGGLGNLTFTWTTNTPRPIKTGQVISRFFSVDADTPNTFEETLTVTDAGGLTSSITKTVVIP